MDGQTYNTHGNNIYRDLRPNAVSTSDVAATCGLCWEKRTDKRESNLVHFSLKMWHLVAKMLTNFLTINWPNFVYLLVDPGFYPPPLNFSETSRFVPPIGWTPLTDTTDKETNNEQTKRRVSSSVRLLDGVWHIRYKANELVQERRLKVPPVFIAAKFSHLIPEQLCACFESVW